MPIPIDPNNDPDVIAGDLVKNLRYPPQGLVAFWGYLGPALKRPPKGEAPDPKHERDLEPPNATVKYWRLYRSLLMNEYIEFRDEDVVNFERLGVPRFNGGHEELAGGVLWLKTGAVIQHIIVDTVVVQSHFLQGSMTSTGAWAQLYGGFASGSPQGSASWGCGQSFACGGQSFSCGGQSFACGGQSFACGGQSFACGGQSFACGGQSFSCGGMSFGC